MAGFRFLLVLLLVAAGFCFVLYTLTGRVGYRRFGLKLLAGVIVAALVFFGVLIAERL